MASLGKPGLEAAQLVHPEEAPGQGPCSSLPSHPHHIPAQPRSHLTPVAETVNEVRTAKCSYNYGAKNKGADISLVSFRVNQKGRGEEGEKGRGTALPELSSGNSTALNIIPALAYIGLERQVIDRPPGLGQTTGFFKEARQPRDGDHPGTDGQEDSVS